MGNYLGLLTAIIPRPSWMKELIPIKTHLGLFDHSEAIISKDTVQSLSLITVMKFGRRSAQKG